MIAASPKPKLIVIGGPTASGKTALAIALAKHLNTVILSADSRQFYHEMCIGVARPDPHELAQATHYFIADRSIQHPLTAGRYAHKALHLLQDLFQQHQSVVVVGGSGLYLKALTEGFDEFPPVSEALRAQVQAFYEKEGLEALQAALQAADPVYFEQVDRQNPVRMIRALAVYQASGQPYSAFRTGASASRPFEPVYLYLNWERPQLYDRINQRVDLMFQQGLLEEARALYPFRALSPLQTVGYQELFDHFDGLHDLDTARQLIQLNSRHYAKRQLTWIRRDGYWNALPPQPDLTLILDLLV